MSEKLTIPTPPDTERHERGMSIEEYVDGYSFRGDSGDYTPTESEKVMLIDALHGAVGEVSGFHDAMGTSGTVATCKEILQVPEGWQLVPNEPTADMREALMGVRQELGSTLMDNANQIYSAFLSSAPQPPAIPDGTVAQEPVAVKAEDIEVIEEVVGSYDWLGTGSSYDHAGKREAEQAWFRIRSAISSPPREPAPQVVEEYMTGENYEMGLWSRRNIEAFLEDQRAALASSQEKKP